MLDLRRALQEAPPPEQTQAPQTGAETNGTGGDAAPEQEQALTTEAYLNEMLKLRGEPDGLSDDMDPQLKGVMEEQYKMQTKEMARENVEGIMEISPEVSKNDAQNFVLDSIQGKWVDAWDRAMKAARKIVEKEQNEKEQKDLRTEGANSGSQGSDDKPIMSRADAKAKILSDL